jgi:hypothetical protein
MSIHAMEMALRDIYETVRRQRAAMKTVIAVTGLARQEFEGLVSRRDNSIGEGGFRFALFYLDFADGLVGNVENALEVYASVVGVDLSVPAPQAEPDAAVPPGDPEVVDADPVAAVPAPRAAPDEEPTPDVT